MSPDAVIFDCDGVVADTEALWDAAGHEFLGRYGVAYDRATLKPQLTGRSMHEGVALMRAAYALPATVEELAEERMAIVIELLRQRTTYVEGFLPFLARTKPRARVAVATGLNDRLFAAVDERLAVRQLFDGAVVTSSMVARAKPEPDLFLAAAELLGVAPEGCLGIADAPLGVQAARAAGMRCVGLTTTYGAELLRAADVVASSFEEIDALLSA